jgi:hypothetical protein
MALLLIPLIVAVHGPGFWQRGAHLKACALLWLGLLAACGGGGGEEGGASSCSPPPSIFSSPPTSATVGVQYLYFVDSAIVCIPLITPCSGFELLQGAPGAQADGRAVFWTPSPADGRKSFTFSIATFPDLCLDRATQSWSVTVFPVSSIQSFTSSSKYVMPGETVDLTAVFEGSGSIEGVGPIASGVPLTVGPINAETSYKLVVQTPFGDVWDQSLTIRILTPPVVTTFIAEPTSIGINAASTLIWWVDGQPDSVRIDPPGIQVASNSAMTVSPSATTTYVLTATNRAGSVTASVDVVVLPPSSIEEFSASASSVALGGEVLLTARFHGTGEILKEDMAGQMRHLATVASGDTVNSGPIYRNTRLTLRATLGDTVTQDLVIIVSGPGTFESIAQSANSVQDAVLLDDGRVFFTAESRGYFFDPLNKQIVTGPFISTHPVRYLTLLLDGRVFVAQPFVTIGCSTALIYNPVTNASSGVSCVPGIPRQAITLQDGRVLIRTDPRNAGEMPGIVLFQAPSTVGPLIQRSTLAGTKGTLLADGRVLFIKPGGTSELFTPGADAFSSSAATFTPRSGDFIRQRLLDGRVLVNGGFGPSSPELYDPATEAVTFGDPQPTPNIQGQGAAVLANGKVLIVGGSGFATALLFDPATRTFTQTGGLQIPRTLPFAVRLQDGRVLVLGGCTFTPCSAELYTP